jgi:hypothetical protein
VLKKIMEKESEKIPLICKQTQCVFDVTECNSQIYWKWLQANRALCPKICPKYKEK